MGPGFGRRVRIRDGLLLETARKCRFTSQLRPHGHFLNYTRQDLAGRFRWRREKMPRGKGGVTDIAYPLAALAPLLRIRPRAE